MGIAFCPSVPEQARDPVPGRHNPSLFHVSHTMIVIFVDALLIIKFFLKLQWMFKSQLVALCCTKQKIGSSKANLINKGYFQVSENNQERQWKSFYSKFSLFPDLLHPHIWAVYNSGAYALG